MRITIDLDGALSRFGNRVATARPQVRRAIVEGLNEGGDKVRTLERRTLKEQTGVKKAGDITKRTGSKRAGPGHLQYEITGTGGGMPIEAFPVRARAGGTVTASPWGKARTFKRSFKSSGRGLLRARLGGSRLPIRALRGPAVSKEIVKDQALAVFEAQAAPMVEGMIVKRLGRLFG